jgi:Tol biopolymer transport system component
MRKALVLAFLALAVIAVGSATAKPRGTNGKIVYSGDNRVTGHEEVYTVDPDGTDKQFVGFGAPGQWAPDGTRFMFFGENDSEVLLNPDTGATTDLHLPFDVSPELAMFCPVWSPDGARLACESFGKDDDALNGVYSIRSTDGGDLRQVTSNPGGDDCPGDYSPDGRRIVFVSAQPNVAPALYVAKLDGKGRRQITPSTMAINFECGSWSPVGDEILFSAHVPTTDYRSTIWMVHADGSGLRQVQVPGCGGLFSSPTAISCNNPSWSPDGRRLVFSRFTAATDRRDLYTVDVRGKDLQQVTDTPDVDEFGSDWGTHRLTP